MSSPLTNDFARVSRRPDGQSSRVPRAPISSVLLAKVNAANPYQPYVDLRTAAGKVLPNLRVIHPITADTPLKPDEWAAVMDLGLGGMFVFGRHVPVGTLPAAILL